MLCDDDQMRTEKSKPLDKQTSVSIQKKPTKTNDQFVTCIFAFGFVILSMHSVFRHVWLKNICLRKIQVDKIRPHGRCRDANFWLGWTANNCKLGVCFCSKTVVFHVIKKKNKIWNLICERRSQKQSKLFYHVGFNAAAFSAEGMAILNTSETLISIEVK